jgi:MerR family mercuric resistance operon transcriptional regulator
MLSIGQLARQAKVSNRTLRYYEELGLIVPKSRGENRYRYYDETHLQRLNTIKMLQDGGFALKEIVAALAPVVDDKGGCVLLGQEMARKIHDALADQRQRLVERQRQMLQTIDDLGRMMQGLYGCFSCTSSQNLNECAGCSKGPNEVIGLGQKLQLQNDRQNDRQNGSMNR